MDEYEPFTQFRPVPRRDKFINITEHGYRPVPDQAPWPPASETPAVFFFGGSTTLGACLPDGQTITAHFQRLANECRERIRVYNFGRGYYFSTQERILYEQLLLSGHIPSLAIFIDGLNDFYYASGEPQWTSALSIFMNSNPGARETLDGIVEAVKRLINTLPVSRYIEIHRAAELPAPVRPPMKSEPSNSSNAEIPHEPGHEESARTVLNRWRANRRMIEAIAQEFGVNVAFVLQPIPTYSYDLRFLNVYEGDPALFGHHIRSAIGYRLIAESVRERSWGKNVLWLGDMQKGRQENLYVDAVHYNSKFSREIAAEIFRFTLRNALLHCSR
jgi:hypothetical protein